MAHFVTSKVRTRTRTMNLNMEATGGPPKETSTFWALKGNPQRPDEKLGDEDMDEETTRVRQRAHLALPLASSAHRLHIPAIHSSAE